MTSKHLYPTYSAATRIGSDLYFTGLARAREHGGRVLRIHESCGYVFDRLPGAYTSVPGTPSWELDRLRNELAWVCNRIAAQFPILTTRAAPLSASEINHATRPASARGTLLDWRDGVEGSAWEDWRRVVPTRGTDILAVLVMLVREIRYVLQNDFPRSAEERKTLRLLLNLVTAFYDAEAKRDHVPAYLWQILD